MRRLIWRLYADLKACQRDPTPRRRWELRVRFDRICRRPTGFATLDRPLRRLHANEAELLMVLDCPEIPLRTNGSESDIRCQVTKRHVSGGTRTGIGRDFRDAFLGLARTCREFGVALRDYLGDQTVPPMPAGPGTAWRHAPAHGAAPAQNGISTSSS